MRKNRKSFTVIKTLILLFFAVSLLFPLAAMLLNLVEVDVLHILSTKVFVHATLNSLSTTLTATVLSICLATLLAWCLARSKVKFKNAFAVLLTLPMLIPSISHGMGLIVLFGKNGVMNNLLHTQVDIYGFWGIVIGSIMYSFPVAFLMLYDIFKYEDYSVYESAQVLGIPKRNQFLSITLPYLRKPMISVFFATFTLIFTDYGVPLMIGGKFMTLPVYMYTEVLGLFNFGKGTVVALILIIPALIAFFFDLLNKDVGTLSFVTKPFVLKKNRTRDAVSYLIIVVTVVAILLPIAVFALLTFVQKYPIDMSLTLHNIQQAFDLSAGSYLFHSLIIALFTAAIGVFISYITAYLTARSRGKSSKALHLISITSLAVPGIVLGLSYAVFFKTSFLYGTIAMLVLVNTMHFFASPYLLAYNAMAKINPNFEAVSKTLGIKRWRLIKDVFVPQTTGTIAEMFSYFFVNSMITISAVSFLSSTRNMPVSLLIPQFEGQMLLECSAFVSLLILAVNIVIKVLIYLVKQRAQRKQTA